MSSKKPLKNSYAWYLDQQVKNKKLAPKAKRKILKNFKKMRKFVDGVEPSVSDIKRNAFK